MAIEPSVTRVSNYCSRLDVRFSVFLLTVVLTFVFWRLALALTLRPRLDFEECEKLASSPISFGLVAGWAAYRQGLKGKKVSDDLVEHFFAGLREGLPELGRPSRLRTVIEVNLETLEPHEREEAVLGVFRADDAIERWAVLEFSPTPRVAEAAIEATERFLVTEELGHLSPAPPVAQRALALLASHQQDIFLRALDEGRGVEEVLVFAIGNARGDGLLDSLGRKLGQGGEAMREAVITSLANFGAAAIPGVQAGLASSDPTTRRDSEPQTIDQVGFVDGIHSEFPSISRISPDVPLEAKIQVANELWEAFGRG